MATTTLKQAERILQTYTLSEIIELNELTEEEVLEFLVDEDFLSIPDPSPVDIYD